MFRECKDNRLLVVYNVCWQDFWVHVQKTQKIASSLFTPEIFTSSVTFADFLFLVHHSESTPFDYSTHSDYYCSNIFHHQNCLGGCGSRIDCSAWQTTNKRPRFSLFLLSFLNYTFLYKKSMLIPKKLFTFYTLDCLYYYGC